MGAKRSKKRLQTLGYILSDGLTYSWFQVEELDIDGVTATLLVDTGDYNDDTGAQIFKRMKITADDVARGLRMYKEMLQGKIEAFPGEWKYAAKDAVRNGTIADVSEFIPTEHGKAHPDSYGWQTVKFSETNGDEGDYDANTADSVMQLATLGQTTYG